MNNTLIGASALFLTLPSLHAALVVDAFSDSGDPNGFTILSVTSSNPVSTAIGEGLLDVLGLRRQTTLEAQTPSVSPSVNYTIALIADSPPSTFVFSSSTNSNAEVTFRYGSAINTGNPAQSVPLNLDATAANLEILELNVAGYSPPSSGAPLLGSVTLFSNGNTASSLPLSFDGTGGVLSFDLTSPAFNGFDLSDIDGISVNVNGSEGADFSLSSIQLVESPTVPESSTALLLSMVLTLATFIRRR